VHDYFDILGVSPDAQASEIRQACARYAPRPHPDFLDAARRGQPPGHDTLAGHHASWRALADVAVDFPDVASLLDRARAAFFRSGGSSA
jgi:hypothetical protein